MKRYKNTSITSVCVPVLLAAAAALLWGCGGAGPGKGGPAGGHAGFQKPGQAVYPVAVMQAVQQRMEDYIELDGDVVPETSVLVYPEIAGTVTRVMVQVGDPVRKDQTLAMVDPSRPGSVYNKSPVTAPVGGTVIDVLADPGQRVSSSVPVAKVGSLSSLRVETRVPERFIGAVHVGTRAMLTFEPFPGQQFDARVVEMSPALSPSSRTIRIELQFDDPKNLVRAGMFAGIKLITSVKPDALAVPSDSVVNRDGKSVVFVLKPVGSDGGEKRTVTARSVVTGMSVDGMTDIIGGLQTGESVVTAGQALLEDGALVTLVEPGRGSAPGGDSSPENGSAPNGGGGSSSNGGAS